MLNFVVTNVLIYVCCLIGLIWAWVNYRQVKSIELKASGIDIEERESLTKDGKNKVDDVIKIGETIKKGADAFLFEEYRILSIFCAVMAVIIKLAVDGLNTDFGTVVAFIFGCVTSILSGWIGMWIAVFSNTRTAFKCLTSLSEGFKVAFRAGCVMGFALTSLSLLVLNSLILVYRQTYSNLAEDEDMAHLYEVIAGYGLGGSTIALFGRVGGGIYTKAADVGADLVGKVEQNFAEDSPKNPATIADNVGDNVGDIAGMGADLFGSFAESTCASLVVLANAHGQRAYAATFACPGGVPCEDADVYLFYPLLVSAFAIIACLFCSLAASHLMSVDHFDEIEKTLRYQLIISAVLLAGTLYVSALLSLDTGGAANPSARGYDNFVLPVEQIGGVVKGAAPAFYTLSVLNAYLCTLSGLVVGLLVGLLTEYYTSNAYEPVQEVAESCRTGAATNIIYGLALGYLSCIIPIILLAIAAYISHKLLGLFGIALAALGMLSNLCVGLAVDAYGPISDNAGGIAEMSELGEETRKKTDALDAAGNTTAAIGKGFAIGSAALVSLSLYGAFITRASKLPLGAADDTAFVISDVQVTDALLFSGLLIGAMLPYAFSALTMKSVGKAALEMVQEIRNQLRKEPKILTGEVEPNYTRCIEISTKASLKEMIAPGALVIFTPIIVGLFFGPRAVAGLLPGALVSGVQMAIASSNTGGAWDNAKKFIESGKMCEQEEVDGKKVDKKDAEGKPIQLKKGTEEHKAAVIGDTVGDPLKDTSGPSLNILVKLSAILSLVFAPFFQNTGLLVCALTENPDPSTLPPGARYCSYQTPPPKELF